MKLRAYEQLKAQYDKAFADHRLELAMDSGRYQGYYLRPKDGGRINSVMILFTPEGITITGDHAPMRNGVCSDFGYDKAWFSAEKGAEYLGVKFGMVQEYQVELAIEYIDEQIAGLGEPDDANADALEAWTELKESVHAGIDPHDFYSSLQEMHIEEFYDVAKGYDPRSLANLAAIQHAFARLIKTFDSDRMAELKDDLPKGEAAVRETNYRDPATDEYEYDGALLINGERTASFYEDAGSLIHMCAEAHQAVMRTGLWPKEMEERIKKLEAALDASKAALDEASNLMELNPRNYGSDDVIDMIAEVESVIKSSMKALEQVNAMLPPMPDTTNPTAQ